jgi:hypothetical protein
MKELEFDAVEPGKKVPNSRSCPYIVIHTIT